MLKKFAGGLAALALAAASTAPALAADGQLYYASIVQQPVKVYIDGQLMGEVPYGKIARWDVQPGQHTIQVVSADGQSAQKTVTLSRAQLAAPSKGGLWWCAASASPDNSTAVLLIVMEQQQCKEFVDAGN